MTLWIIIAIFCAVPAYLHWRGRGIVALSLSAACLYGLGVLVLFLLTKAPPAVVSRVLGFITSLSNPATDRTYHDTYYVIAKFEAAILPTASFATIALVFWALTHWGAPIFQRILKVLFWMLHGALLAAPLVIQSFVGQGMPRRAIDTTEMDSPLALIGVLQLVIALALFGFALAAFWSVFRKLRL